MKRILAVMALVALAMGNLWAGNVNEQRAQRVGQRFLSNTVLGQERAGIQLQLVSSVATRGEVDYYVFNVSGGEGFVIVAGDDRVKPILAYSTTGSFNPEDVADGFAFTLSGYRSEIQYVREHHLAATPDIKAEWESVYKSGSLQNGRKARAVVGPLCQTIWNQNYPYNNQCPEDAEGSGGYVYAGCVATAMGQVMKYYDWPNQGTGSHSYYPSGYTTQTANYAETEYHFELMPLSLDSTSTDDEIFYIAQFLHHCGIAVDMQYSGHGSGAYSEDVPYALRNYFRYSCDDHETNYSYWGWGGYSNEEWTSMLKAGGLDELIPLYYSGQDDSGSGGHAFVCDGYDENNYFHYNWGWSGRDDAWCPIGALNTTKYAFNTNNGFTGHIVPQNGEYYQRPDSIIDMQLVENRSFDGVTLRWTNPEYNLNGQALTAIESVTVRRNNEVIATLTEVQPGAEMSLEDNDLAPGLYEYAIFVTNEAGISRNTYRTVLVGEKCDVTFQLHDDGGDGWKGAAISVTDENGARIAVIGMTEGSDATVTMPLLRQNLSFIWNHGWYHSAEEYDTDFECSFTVYDANGNELYASAELEDGVFMTYVNNCETGILASYPVRNLTGNYQWNEVDDFGALLAWDQPVIIDHLDHFVVYRCSESGEPELVTTIPFGEDEHYEFFDNLTEVGIGNYLYKVTSLFVDGEQEVESNPQIVEIMITSVDDHQDYQVRVFPNPTNGLLRIDGKGMMSISVYNMLGQKMLETKAEGNASIDLSRCESGVYMIRIETGNAVMVQKVTVNKD